MAAEPAGRDDHRRQARGRQARRRGAHAAAQLYAARSSRMPRWRRPAPWRAGANRPRGLDAHPGHLQPARRSRGRSCARPPDGIVVEHMEGAGCYGQNGADDVALDAVLLARAGARPAGAPAMVARGRAGVGAARRRAWPSTSRPTSTQQGEIVGWRARRLEQRPRVAAGPGARRRRCWPHRSSPSRSSAPSPSTRRSRPAAARSATPCRSTISRPGRSPTTALLTMPIRTSSLRTLGRVRQRVRASSRSWTNWRPSAARTRSPSACAT